MAQTQMTMEQMMAAFTALKAENEALKAKQAAQADRKLTCKVSTKGALSIYGMGRFPITLYVSQWEKLRAALPEIDAFVKANAESLTRKG